MIQLTRTGNEIRARVGLHNPGYPAGYGETLSAALRDLANRLEAPGTNIWVPAPARPYCEDGVEKIACPECGAIKVSDFDHVIAFVCDACGSGIDVEH